MIINSSKIGYGAQASGISGMAIGDNAHANNHKSIAIGPAAAVSGFSGIAVGVDALDVENNGNSASVVVGTAASSWGGSAGANVIIGARAKSSSANTIAIGGLATVTGAQGMAIGLDAITNGSYGMAFGFNSIVNNNASIIFNGQDTGPNQFAAGNSTNPITAMYIGAGVSADHVFTTATTSNTPSPNIQVSAFGNGTTFVGDKITGPGIAPNTVITVINGGSNYSLNKTVTPQTNQQFQVILGSASINANGGEDGGSDNNIGGTDLVVAGGKSTGTGIGGSVRLQTTFPGPASANTQNPLVDRFFVNGYQTALTDSTTNDLFQIALPTLTAVGGIIHYEIYATDGTDVQSYTGFVRFSAVNKAGTYTTTIDDSGGGTGILAASAGTLTATWSISTGTPTDTATVQVSPASSITPTIYNITYTLTNNSPQAITTL